MSAEHSITHIRPRFKFEIGTPKAIVLEQIATLLDSQKESVTGTIIDNHIILDILAKDRHYWSPQLNFRVEADEDDPAKSVIYGLIGPRPAVWTLFMFIYFGVGALGFFISAFGVSKLMLGEYSNLILALPLAILFMLTAYGTGKYGERLGADQIEVLKQFVRDALALPNPVAPEIRQPD